MNSYKLDYTLGIDQQKTLSELVRRCREINSWGEQELLQYAATANSKAEIEMKLQFLQEQIPLLEDENQKETLKKQVRITEKEHLKCRKVADAFAELYSVDLLVLDAGIYGFVKLQYYHPLSAMTIQTSSPAALTCSTISGMSGSPHSSFP